MVDCFANAKRSRFGRVTLETEVEHGSTSKTKRHDWFEIAAAVLLALATVASAWSAYQSSRWHGVESRCFAEANATRIHSSEAADVADEETAVDAALFADYCYAYSEGQTRLVDFYENRMFRPEMKAAVEAWKATGPLVDPEAPETPFDMKEYVNSNKLRSDRLEKEAQEHTADARAAIGHADDYILLTVMFASVLFFAGISTKFGTRRIKIVLLSLGGAFFLGSLVVLAFQPVH